MAFKKGDLLRQKMFVAQGSVLDVRYDADSGAFAYLIGFTDESGVATERWFDEGAVEVVPPEEGAPA